MNYKFSVMISQKKASTLNSSQKPTSHNAVSMFMTIAEVFAYGIL